MDLSCKIFRLMEILLRFWQRHLGVALAFDMNNSEMH